jgi:hypothetical protein
MLLIQNYDTIIFERYGQNKLTSFISDEIIKIINQNIGQLILNGSITLKSVIPKIKGITFTDDIINISISNRFYGNINPSTMIIKDNNINNLVLNLELILTPIEIQSRRLIDNNIESTIEHELLHTIEKYLTIIDGNKLSNSFSMDEQLKKLDKLYKNSQNWLDISYLIYLSFPHEIRARIQQLNKDIENKHIKGIPNVINYIKTTKIYKDLNFLTNIDEYIILKKLKNDKDYKDILENFSKNVLNNNNINYEKNFTDYIKKIKQKNKKMLDKLERTSYNFENINNDKVIKYKEFL